jgi:hypothetical protein
VRRHAKALPVGSGPTIGMAAFGLACFCLLAFAALGGRASAATDSCPNAAVRVQQNAQALADCRAYEMVTPLQKNNGEISVNATARAAANGNGIQYEARSAFAGAEGGGFSNQYVGWRSATGWTTEALNPYVTPDWMGAVPDNEGAYELLPDLSKGVMLAPHDPNDRSGDVSRNGKRLYLRVKGGGFTPISPKPLSPEFFDIGPVYTGSSTDMSRVFMESNGQLTPDAPLSTYQAYEWHEGQFSLIGRLPNGEVALEGARVGAGLAGLNVYKDLREAVSGDGTQVVLTIGSPSQVYLRENGQSRLISGSQVSGEEGTPALHGATFMGSSSVDGAKLSTLYFASPGKLTDDAEAAPESAVDANELYAYDVESGELRFLSERTNPSARPSAEVIPYWVTASDDGRYVYFLAGGQLTPGSSRDSSIYLWHDGEVTALGGQGYGTAFNTASPGLATRNRTSVSPDGKRLLVSVTSGRQGALLTSDAPPCAAGSPEGSPGCPYQVYLYDAPSNDWSCLSCNPSGPNTSNGLLKATPFAGYAGLAYQSYRLNNLTPDGSRAFFDTAESLVPRDQNGANDVYEWHEGQINLLSSGRGEGAYFMDASPEGSDVFIATRERLAPEDVDNFIDAYDAREGGGFIHTPPSPACEGDACQAEPGTAPAAASPASSLLAGAGNAAPRRKARCAAARKGKKSAKSSKAARKAKARCAKTRQNKKPKGSAKGKGGKR